MNKTDLEHFCEELYRKNGMETLDEYEVEHLFAVDNQAWKILFAASSDAAAQCDFDDMRITLEDIFTGSLQYRAWRITNFGHDAKEDALNPWYTYHKMETDYSEIRSYVLKSEEYSVQQKQTYLLLLSAGVLNATGGAGVDKDFYDYFMTSELCRQVIRDRNSLLGTITKKHQEV